MQASSVEAIVRALDDHQVKYLIVGGLAVVAHGYVRFTADVDLMLAVDEPNLARAVEALRSLGYQPRAPVAFDEYVNADARRRWATEKGMTVFSLFSAAHPATEIDLFLDPPIDFAAAHSRAVRLDVMPGISAAFCSLDDLIALKSKADRPVDRDDIAQLRQRRSKDQR
jgi:predicted nucleotidyltransferase